jgi:hypothetical protein
MICDRCDGKGAVWAMLELVPGPQVLHWRPCPHCIGGISYCCDSLKEQPEEETNAP